MLASGQRKIVYNCTLFSLTLLPLPATCPVCEAAAAAAVRAAES